MAGEHVRRVEGVARVQIDGNAERFDPLPERIVPAFVEIAPVGVAVDQGAFEFELFDAARKFVGRRRRVLQRQMGETGVARGMLGDFARQEVVLDARALDRDLRVGLRLHAGRRHRKHGQIDAGLVHRFEPHFAEIEQPLLEALERRRTPVRPRVLRIGRPVRAG